MQDNQQYKIIRKYASGRADKEIERCLTLEQAQQHCSDPKTSHKDKKDWLKSWFDCYTKQ